MTTATTGGPDDRDVPMRSMEQALEEVRRVGTEISSSAATALFALQLARKAFNAEPDPVDEAWRVERQDRAPLRLVLVEPRWACTARLWTTLRAQAAAEAVAALARRVWAAVAR